MTVQEVSRLAGVSVRTLHYYDQIGLLRPTTVTETGYRLYDDTALERLQQILLFRELEFPLKDIKTILDQPDFDRNKALSQQIELLTLKKERLERLIRFAREIKETGAATMEFQVFDTSNIDAYTRQAKAQWGDTAAYREFEQKTAGQPEDAQMAAAEGLMDVFRGFGALRDQSPEAPAVRTQVEALQAYLSAHYYTCTPEILAGLGQLYAQGEFAENIDRAGGPGTAALVSAAIEVYCR